jgi:hypothetical protein
VALTLARNRREPVPIAPRRGVLQAYQSAAGVLLQAHCLLYPFFCRSGIFYRLDSPQRCVALDLYSHTPYASTCLRADLHIIEPSRPRYYKSFAVRRRYRPHMTTCNAQFCSAVGFAGSYSLSLSVVRSRMWKYARDRLPCVNLYILLVRAGTKSRQQPIFQLMFPSLQTIHNKISIYDPHTSNSSPYNVFLHDPRSSHCSCWSRRRTSSGTRASERKNRVFQTRWQVEAWLRRS